ncbi:CoA ester lyase [Micromonospora sp. DPT]|uniref:HpcH/HpaI aldolase/citrate lyase family protein n=1 Tax=Micromonospora sp. DPT TaxID=3142975 RepID=UPI00320A2795
MRLARSYLYVPGNAPDKLPKAAASIADALIIDLEDAVPWSGKAEARREVRAWLSTQTASTKELWVRINSGDEALADIEALEGISSLTGLVLAKAGSADDVRTIGDILTHRGHTSLLLSPLLETPGAIFQARQIARQPRVLRLQIGEYDLCAEAGITPGPDEFEVAVMRSQVVLASAEAGIQPPPAPVSIEIKDNEAFRRSTQTASRQGFVGRACIHPSQLAVVHETFTPDEGALEQARSVLQLFDEQVQAGSGVLIDANGRLLDEAVVRQARRTLNMAARP